MDQAGIVTLIDEALERFAGRDLVSSSRGRRPPARHAQRRRLRRRARRADRLRGAARALTHVRTATRDSCRDASEFADVVQ